MKTVYGDVVLITGASSGIGKALANFLMSQGYKVYGTTRKPVARETELKTSPNGGYLRMIQLDVRSEESIRKALEYIIEREGALHVLINNAGFGIAGSVEDTTAAEAHQQFDTNFFGVLRMCNQVVPIMRRQHKGLIINVSSVAGLIAIPFQGMYSASKYAVEALTEALRMEVKPFGIRVTMVEPGDTKTGFTANRQTVAAAGDSIYKERFTRSIRVMADSEQNGPEPKTILRIVAKLLQRKNPPIRTVIGGSYKMIVFLKRVLPSRFVEFVVSRIY